MADVLHQHLGVEGVPLCTLIPVAQLKVVTEAE